MQYLFEAQELVFFLKKKLYVLLLWNRFSCLMATRLYKERLRLTPIFNSSFRNFSNSCKSMQRVCSYCILFLRYWFLLTTTNGKKGPWYNPVLTKPILSREVNYYPVVAHLSLTETKNGAAVIVLDLYFFHINGKIDKW